MIIALEGPIRRRRVYEEVEARLEEEIRRGRLQPGDSLPSERELMQLFGVGRPAVREAILSLQKKGLLQVGAGERSRITRPTLEGIVNTISGPVNHLLGQADGLRNLQDARAFFEAGLARRAAQLADDGAIARLEAALAANRAALADLREFERTDLGFHLVVAQMSGNPIFASLHHALAGWLASQRSVSLVQPGAARHALGCHERILEAIRNRDPDRAAAEMEQHLAAVADFYWKSLEPAPSRPRRTRRRAP